MAQKGLRKLHPSYALDAGTAVAKCYKSEVRWFDSRWCHWNFLLT